MATAALSAARPNRLNSVSSDVPLHPLYLPSKLQFPSGKTQLWRSTAILLRPRGRRCAAPRASSRADDSPPPFDMSVETALKVLGVSEGASFDEILRAKKSILASRKDDPSAISQAEAAYDMLLMQSLNQRRAGKVVSNNIRYADVKSSSNPLGTGTVVSQWIKNPPVSVDTPSTSDLGIQAGVYGAMMVLTYVNGSSLESSGMPYAGADVPGLILASSFGASLYFMTKKKVKLGKAAALTAGGLVAGAVVGSAVETWLHVDVVPFLGLHSPAAVVSEFIVFSQFLVSLCLR
ncbi:PREDICTED: protein CHAPERONE-LIKE PROTEIN OF POR1, chloroplastic-like [Camelina sativa]|uniref:Protein CHAPERONE-LIKE PROTEIN OF POR1, chloroplastic-like n=1 Tax=Camelina sativa TaxID=90675 RepID=A0ABM0SVR6_CAMSA|nr:PREDICTED: protein CHAPERONE-LIKE PROTEIN OF POR1, chloroplastic-like [Camelina sativa]